MKADLHVHTSYSFDSLTPPHKIVEVAIKKGINCLAITDHSEIKGALEAIDYAKGKSILIIPGIEIKSREGDILALNVKEIIPDGLSAEETIKKIKALGGFSILPHPYGLFCGFRGDLRKLEKEIDGIEVLNGSIFGSGDKEAFNFSQQHQLPFTVGSDAHFPNFVGEVFLEIPGENLSVEEVLKKIKNREGKIGGKKPSLIERIVDHFKRNFVKIYKKF